MSAVRRLARDRSALLVVDIQQKLAPHVEGHEALLGRTLALVSAARRFGVPVLATEHSADRIGPLVPALRERLVPDDIFAKNRFSACDEPRFAAWLAQRGRTQVVVAGMEAHVCLMQTALGLAGSGIETFVVADAAGSRAARREDRALALARLRDAGCTLAGTETVLFEWTGGADDPAFREVLAWVKGLPAS